MHALKEIILIVGCLGGCSVVIGLFGFLAMYFLARSMRDGE
jgi:hypothetical protein